MNATISSISDEESDCEVSQFSTAKVKIQGEANSKN